MRLVRLVVFGAAAVLLAGGYLASQFSFVASRNPETSDATKKYAESIDSGAVSLLALAILVACVVLSLIQDKEEEA